MTGYTTTIPAYVRTSAGIVKVGAGQRIPEDALPGDLDRLAAAGVAVRDPESDPDQVAETGADPAVEPAEKTKRSRRPAAHKPATKDAEES